VGILVAGTMGGRLGKALVDGHEGLPMNKYNESCANRYDIPMADHNVRAEAREQMCEMNILMNLTITSPSDCSWTP
jgi:hypothetical protein